MEVVFKCESKPPDGDARDATGDNPAASLPNPADLMVLQAQLGLQARGYDPGIADGVFGLQTRAALSNYQRDSALAVTGRLDEKALVSIGITSQ